MAELVLKLGQFDSRILKFSLYIAFARVLECRCGVRAQSVGSVTPWTAEPAQAGTLERVPFPASGVLPDPEIQRRFPASPALAGGSSPLCHRGSLHS